MAFLFYIQTTREAIYWEKIPQLKKKKVKYLVLRNKLTKSQNNM